MHSSDKLSFSDVREEEFRQGGKRVEAEETGREGGREGGSITGCNCAPDL